jgi:hypothetical protein
VLHKYTKTQLTHIAQDIIESEQSYKQYKEYIEVVKKDGENLYLYWNQKLEEVKSVVGELRSKYGNKCNWVNDPEYGWVLLVNKTIVGCLVDSLKEDVSNINIDELVAEVNELPEKSTSNKDSGVNIKKFNYDSYKIFPNGRDINQFIHQLDYFKYVDDTILIDCDEYNQFIELLEKSNLKYNIIS